MISRLASGWTAHRKSDDFWKRWEKEYLLQLRNFHEVSQPHKRPGKVRIGDIVLQEDCRPRHMWKARVEELKVGRDGAKRTAVLRGADGGVFIRPIQLVIPLDVDQGGENVGDHLYFMLRLWRYRTVPPHLLYVLTEWCLTLYRQSADCFIQRPNSYCAVNTFHVGYKHLSVCHTGQKPLFVLK